LLCAHRISKHRATKVYPFEFVYRHELVVLSVEINLNAIRFARQNNLTVGDYCDLMMNNTDKVTDKMLKLRKTKSWLPRPTARR
jgi:hypothetical protein